MKPPASTSTLWAVEFGSHAAPFPDALRSCSERISCIRAFVVVLFAVTAVVCLAAPVVAESPIAIDAQRELLVDDYLIDRFDGRAELRLHQPTPREIVLLFNEPWEGNSCGAYHTVLRDGDRYRMYYIACQQTLKGEMASHPIFTCYAESNDGVHWVKPELGQFEFAGSKKNNIIMWKGYDRDSEAIIVPFKDANPACQPEQRYKAMVNIHSSLHACNPPTASTGRK